MTQTDSDTSSCSVSSKSILREDNIVVLGPSRRVAGLLRGGEIIVNEVCGLAGPGEMSLTTRAVVVVVDDVTRALERAALVRAWVHKSVLPLIFVSEFETDARNAELWCSGLCSLDLEHNSIRLQRLLCSLKAGRAGLPDDHDVDLGFRLRMRLRHPELKAVGTGFDVFVANRTVFLAGLLAPGACPARVTALLAPLGKARINTDALLCGHPQG